MRLFDQDFVDLLNTKCTGEEIHFIGLGQFDFQLSFGPLRGMRNTLKIEFSIEKQIYIWKEGPCDIPVWRLIGQVPTAFSLITPDQLRMNLQDGNYVTFFTNEDPYENHIAEFTPVDGAIPMEIF